MKIKTPTEHDFLGEKEIPEDKYYGVQTLRAIENFNITGIPISKVPLFVKGFEYVKKAAALAKMVRNLFNRESHSSEIY
jgi:aspartate ammonia-lyase